VSGLSTLFVIRRWQCNYFVIDVTWHNDWTDEMVLQRGFMSGIEQPPSVPASVIDSVYATNVLGVTHMTQAILPIFKARGSGDVIFIGSIAGREPYVGGTVSNILSKTGRMRTMVREVYVLMSD
jgi:NADP-dependent 3-hydroxy acid dehydrogenase YdfG